MMAAKRRLRRRVGPVEHVEPDLTDDTRRMMEARLSGRLEAGLAEAEDRLRWLAERFSDLTWDDGSDDGACFGCGGRLDTVSCGQDCHVGCMGYGYTGDHDDDCPLGWFLASPYWPRSDG